MIRNIAAICILSFILGGCFLGAPNYYPRRVEQRKAERALRDIDRRWERSIARGDAERERRNIQRRLGDIEQRERYRSLY